MGIDAMVKFEGRAEFTAVGVVRAVRGCCPAGVRTVVCCEEAWPKLVARPWWAVWRPRTALVGKTKVIVTVAWAGKMTSWEASCFEAEAAVALDFIKPAGIEVEVKFMKGV